jgi:hypothetical protein
VGIVDKLEKGMRFAADAIIVQIKQQLAASRKNKSKIRDTLRPVLYECKRYLYVSVMTPTSKRWQAPWVYGCNM